MKRQGLNRLCLFLIHQHIAYRYFRLKLHHSEETVEKLFCEELPKMLRFHPSSKDCNIQSVVYNATSPSTLPIGWCVVCRKSCHNLP